MSINTEDGVKRWYIDIPIEPVAKARPRGTMLKNGKVVYYTTSKTAHAENMIRDRAIESGVYFEKGTPLEMYLTFVFRKPKSAPKHRKYPVVAPDDDNCEKLVRDALNKIMFYDDCQIVRTLTEKVYGDIPCIKIRLRELE